MNRREFIRTAIATTTLMAVGAAGIFEIASKAGANQASAQQQGQQLQLPSISSATSQSSTTQLSQGAPSTTSSSQVSTASSQSSSAAAPAGYVLVAALSSLSGKTSAYFTHPTHGHSMLLSLNGQWKAFSATCTHRPCTVEFQSSEIYCPCHGATFSATNGSVTQGPAQVALGEYGVIEQNGDLYVSDSVIN
jgi:cytochrome b6-f complex iron-sulfur subunit